MRKFILFFIFLFLFEPSFSLLIYGHRGARGLSPENTLVAYRKALTIGVNFIDMDVSMTKDGVLVVTHDYTLNKDITKDRQGHWVKEGIFIKSLTLKQLQTYNVCALNPESAYAKYFKAQASYPPCTIPTLEEVINMVRQFAGDHIGFQIEIKTNPTHPEWTFSPDVLARALVSVIRDKGIEALTEVQAFDFRCLQAVQQLDPKIRTAYLTEYDSKKMMLNPDTKIAGLWTGGALLKNYHNSIPQLIEALGGRLWDPQDEELNVAFVQEAHKLGLKVVVWSWPEYSGTEYDKTMMLKLIQWQVDGIITDRPDLLRQLMIQLHMPVPKPIIIPTQA
ncbi:MAG: hypothetical protein A3F41_04785 [Coxiella sp. RIFCSPHIGHO2_12_FULL_44_14]|nr:MAG: hypothetical protein A3F41_04785 [Coxiella sp. RIFCSPHIGHO2_12_FULL_44_14]